MGTQSQYTGSIVLTDIVIPEHYLAEERDFLQTQYPDLLSTALVDSFDNFSRPTCLAFHDIVERHTWPHDV